MGDLVFIYANKFFQHPGKFQMHWLGQYVIIFMTEVGGVHLNKLNGEIVEGMVNDIRMKLYRDNCPSVH
jgi:hypothetical protein